jgi:predicted phage baseplate assembly protein
MPIRPPSLDDRRFDDLVDDLIARIPAHTPEWTNPRLGDPGRTLIELFAWLGDALLYRANLVPERQRLVFLKLLGMGLQPAQPAAGIVSLSFAQPTVLDAHTLSPQATIKGTPPFESLAETTVLPITGEAYIKRALASDEQARRSDLLQGLARIHHINGSVQAYETTPVFAGGVAVPAGIDVFSTSADRALWIALLAPRAAKPVDQPATNAAVVAALGGALPALLSIGVVPAITPPALFEQVSAPAAVPVQWETTRRGTSALDTDYLNLDVASDTSGGLGQAGVLRLRLPARDLIWAPSNDVGVNPRAGVGDAPPRLDDADRAARLVTWVRLRPKNGELVRHLPLAWLGVNAVQVDQRNTLSGRVLGTSNGLADQSFPLPLGSVDPATLQIQVEETGRGYQPWTRVDDLAAISADAAIAREAGVYELDPEAGTLRFGDGLRGRIPDTGNRIRLAFGRFGGGSAGNVPAGTLAELQGREVGGQNAPPIKVQQPLAMAGGADAETLAVAEQRIPSRLRHRDRAVTADDYRALATQAPAVDVGRVEVLPRFRPSDRRFEVPGVVSVMALPVAALAPAPNPRPDRPFIERLHNYLAARTPLATELYVIGCEYVAVGVSVAVTLRDGFAPDQVLQDVRDALRRLLWPLPPGGIGATGWPLGRAVRSRELEVEVARVAGVDELNGIHLFRRNGNDWQKLPSIASDGAQILTLQPWQLPELLAVIAVEGQDVPNDLRALPNPFANENAVAVPVVPELC